ncbi:hypothetical protein QZH41_007265 [Actinostola sp. cb2023]|nr:hypothetical protein QZH41_000180 [Actinostola sp. cb2023]KAK3738165.1 hypothetical protein QZH41_007265 [Actinostola sp. cb2023]
MSQNRPVTVRDSDQHTRVLDDLEKAMKEMPMNMRAFSLCLRELYVEKAVGTNHAAARKFRKIRDDTKNDAMLYLQGILPVSTRLVIAIEEFFDDFIELDHDTWIKNLSNIQREKVQYCSGLCKKVKKMHEEIMIPLKRREDEAKEVMVELSELQQEFEEEKARLERKSNRKHSWAWGFLFSSNSQIASQLFASSGVDLANAVAQGAQAQTQEAAALAVSQILIPALKAFVDGLDKVSSFFMAMNAPEMRHFNIGTDKAREIKYYCQQFIRILPSVRTDFQAIPTEGTDQNYIDRWLEKQTKTIKETCTEKPPARDAIAAVGGESKPPKSRACKKYAEGVHVHQQDNQTKYYRETRI